MNNRQKSQVTGASFTDKIRSSLVLKLNLRMLGVLLTAFLAINVLISILFFGMNIWQAESGVHILINTFGIPDTPYESEVFEAGGYRIENLEDPARGVTLPGFIQDRMPLQSQEASRRISSPNILQQLSLRERTDMTSYIVNTSIEGQPVRITYSMGTEIHQLFFLLFILTLFEITYMLGSIGKNMRAIRSTLKPLSEMAETARSLNEELSSMSAGTDGAGIKNLAGAISTIDAKQLDKRISVDSSQNELKDLAHAINEMLNRISESYQSQVRFVSDASHELRTPIAVIQGYASLLDRWGKKDEETLQESIDAIKGETESMKVLVEQLLFLARGDNETMQLHRTIFDVCSIIEEIIRENRIIDPSHIFETRLSRPAYLEADQQLLKQAVRILVDNSIKYTPHGEKIIIKVAQQESMVNIIVQDNGIGIAPEDVPHIFDRFYRSDESRARKTGGSGLGLAIAKWIVERHNGYFEVLSRIDIGTRTTIVLPAAEKRS
jgi:two-component system, OmpR family, sensor histidine kinase ArlS